MYSESSFQVRYRRKIYEAIATMAYSWPTDAQFKWLPEAILSKTSASDFSNEVSSDMDYIAESCRAALGLEPASYKEAVFSEAAISLRSADMNTERQPMLCALKSVCHKCASVSGKDKPCAKACPKGAISSDAFGRTVIDNTKCDSCGKCMCACQNGAIIDKSNLYQVISAIGEGSGVYAVLAPGLSAQFEPRLHKTELTSALRLLGFSDTVELKQDKAGSEKQRHSAGSCCEGWRSSDSKEHVSCCVSKAGSYKSAILKETEYIHSFNPDAIITLVVPCAISKLEAARQFSQSGVDYVLDYEEILAMLLARGVDSAAIRKSEEESLRYII